MSIESFKIGFRATGGKGEGRRLVCWQHEELAKPKMDTVRVGIERHIKEHVLLKLQKDLHLS